MFFEDYLQLRRLILVDHGVPVVRNGMERLGGKSVARGSLGLLKGSQRWGTYENSRHVREGECEVWSPGDGVPTIGGALSKRRKTL